MGPTEYGATIPARLDIDPGIVWTDTSRVGYLMPDPNTRGTPQYPPNTSTNSLGLSSLAHHHETSVHAFGYGTHNTRDTQGFLNLALCLLSC